MNKLEISHFSRNEAACKCGCGFNAQDWELLEVLEDTRRFFGKKVFVNSWCRCKKYNEKIKGFENSYHIKALAADIWLDWVPSDLVADYFERSYSDKYGIGRYNSFTHIDVRPNKARWDKRE